MLQEMLSGSPCLPSKHFSLKLSYDGMDFSQTVRIFIACNLRTEDRIGLTVFRPRLPLLLLVPRQRRHRGRLRGRLGGGSGGGGGCRPVEGRPLQDELHVLRVLAPFLEHLRGEID